jgi:DNA-binding transcriptional regulator YdaS (Cro superfamily)
MSQFKELQIEFGSLASIASKLGVRESAIYQWVARKNIPLRHVKTLIELSEGRLTKEMLRPDLYKKD